MKWEITVAHEWDAATKMSVDGWELVSCTYDPNDYVTAYYFKRQLKEEHKPATVSGSLPIGNGEGAFSKRYPVRDQWDEYMKHSKEEFQSDSCSTVIDKKE